MVHKNNGFHSSSDLIAVCLFEIDPDSSLENVYMDSFIGKLHDELMDQKPLLSLDEARYVAEYRRLDLPAVGRL